MVGGHAWLVRPMRQADRIKPGRPLRFTGVPVTGIGVESRIDLNTFVVTDPSFRRLTNVKGGVLDMSQN